VCAQDASQDSTTASLTGYGSSSSSGSGSSLITFRMKSSRFKLTAAFKGFLHRWHKGSSSSSSPSFQPCNTALAGQDDAAAADVALLSCPDGNKQSSSIRLASTTSSYSSKHASCASGGPQSSATAAEDGLSDAAASSDMVLKHVRQHQRHQQSLGKQQQPLAGFKLTAARLRAAMAH